MSAVEKPSVQNSLLELALEVLAEEPDDERRDEHERRDDGELLRDLVLVLRDRGLEVVAHAGEQVSRDVELLGDAHERVVGVAEGVRPRRGRVRGPHVDAAVEDPADGRPASPRPCVVDAGARGGAPRA